MVRLSQVTTLRRLSPNREGSVLECRQDPVPQSDYHARLEADGDLVDEDGDEDESDGSDDEVMPKMGLQGRLSLRNESGTNHSSDAPPRKLQTAKDVSTDWLSVTRC